MTTVVNVSNLEHNIFYNNQDINNITFIAKNPIRYKYKCMMKSDEGVIVYVADSGLLSLLLQGYYDAKQGVYDFDLSDIITSDDISLVEDGYIYDGDSTIYMISSITASTIKFKNKTNMVILLDPKNGTADTSVDIYNILDIDSCILMQSFR